MKILQQINKENTIGKYKKYMGTMGIIIIIMSLAFSLMVGLYLTKETKNIKTEYIDVCNDKIYTVYEGCILVLSLGISIGLIFHGFPFKFTSYTDSSTIYENESD